MIANVTLALNNTSINFVLQSNPSVEADREKEAWLLLFRIAVSSIGVVTMFFNGIIIFALLIGTAVKSEIVKLLLLLAIADFIAGIISALSIFEEFNVEKTIPNQVRNSSMAAIGLISANLTAFISMDRYYGVKSNFETPINKKCKYICLPLCWSIPLASVVFIKISNDVKTFLLVPVEFVISGSIIVVGYILLLRKLRSQTNTVEVSNITMKNTRKKNERKVSETCAVLVSCFIGMQLPFAMVVTINAIIGETFVVYILLGFTFCISLANSTVNPMVYAFRSSVIKNDFLHMIDMIRQCTRI